MGLTKVNKICVYVMSAIETLTLKLIIILISVKWIKFYVWKTADNV